MLYINDTWLHILRLLPFGIVVVEVMFFENEIGMVAVERDIGVMVKRIIFVEGDASKVDDEFLAGAWSTYHAKMILITNYYILLMNIVFS